MVKYVYGSYRFHDTKDQNGTHHPKVVLNFIKVFKSDFSTSCDSSCHCKLTCSRHDIPEALLRLVLDNKHSLTLLAIPCEMSCMHFQTLNVSEIIMVKVR